MLVSGLFLALYAWIFFQSVDSVSESLLVSDRVAIVAVATFVYAAAAYLFSPLRSLRWTSLIGYWLLIALCGLLIAETGYMSSPFVALWAIVALFAAVFGMPGVIPVIAGVAGYLVLGGDGKELNFESGALALLLGILPVAIGYLAWRTRSGLGSALSSEERSLSELTSRLETVSGQSEIVIAAIADGVVSVDKAGTVQLINPAAQNMLGWGKNDALGLDYKSVLKLIDSRDNAPTSANDPIAQALSSGSQIVSDVFRLQTADTAKPILVSLTTTPIAGTESGAIIVFRDITREKIEEREQAEFISTASHEMRTPVASIEGYLGLALNPSTATIDAKAREYINKAQEAAKHLGQLFQDLLDVSRADDGRLVSKPSAIDLVPFVHDVVIGQLPAAQAKSLTIDYPPQPDFSGETTDEQKNVSPVFYVTVDSDHLREIVGNLLENAIKYTMSGGVTIDVAGDSDSVTISVKDTGIGIPAEDVAHLFQKFYRVDSSETREIGGTGLGLYLCRRLAEAIGGKLWVESTYGQGSTFYLKLPRTDAAVAQQAIATQAAAAMQALTSSASTGPVGPPPVVSQTPLPAAQPGAPLTSQPAAAPPPAPVTSVAPSPTPQQATTPQQQVGTIPAATPQPPQQQYYSPATDPSPVVSATPQPPTPGAQPVTPSMPSIATQQPTTPPAAAVPSLQNRPPIETMAPQQPPTSPPSN